MLWTALPFIIAGLIFLFLGFKADPSARTDDGYSLKWFWFIMGAWFIGLTVVVYGGIAFILGRIGRKRRGMIEFGRRGTAAVLSFRTTGSELDNMIQVELELRVNAAGMPPYGISHREFVSPANLSGLQVGAQIPVLVDPEDRNKLMIDWREAQK